MAKQKIAYPDFGARSERVLDILAPLVGTAAPSEHAEFIGQTYVNTTAGKGYMSVATDSTDAADDWKEVTFVAGA